MGEKLDAKIEGIVHARNYEDRVLGKYFLGATLEGNDGKDWVISYDEQSPFHPFAGHKVVATGEGYRPTGQHLIRRGQGRRLGHFRVKKMRLAEPAPDARLIEVEEQQHLVGQFHHGIIDTEDYALFLVTEDGTKFQVVNEPAGFTTGLDVRVSAFPVERSPLIPTASWQYLWIICPCSAADLWKWRFSRRLKARISYLEAEEES